MADSHNSSPAWWIDFDVRAIVSPVNIPELTAQFITSFVASGVAALADTPRDERVTVRGLETMADLLAVDDRVRAAFTHPPTLAELFEAAEVRRKQYAADQLAQRRVRRNAALDRRNKTP